MALGATQSEPPAVLYDNGPRNVFVMLGSEAEVASLKPDMGALAALGALQRELRRRRRRALQDADVRPGIGIAEDPATGSAAGPLALHLARNGRIAFGQRIEITQGVEIQRPSLLFARVDGGADSMRSCPCRRRCGHRRARLLPARLILVALPQPIWDRRR